MGKPLGADERFAFAALLAFDFLARRFMCRLTQKLGDAVQYDRSRRSRYQIRHFIHGASAQTHVGTSRRHLDRQLSFRAYLCIRDGLDIDRNIGRE